MALQNQNPTLYSNWQQQISEIKDLFYSQKYKRCATICEELQKTAVHPIHKSSLYFYRALCLESLGSASHVYSTNKLPLLTASKKCFLSALQSLQSPDTIHSATVDATDPTSSDIDSSPLNAASCVTSKILKRYSIRSPLTECSTATVSPCDSSFSEGINDGTSKCAHLFESQTRSSSVSSYEDATDQLQASCSEDESALLSSSEQIPSSRKVTFQANLTTPETASTPHNIAKFTAEHKSRLSESLSSTHCLADELVPTPLFKRTDKLEMPQAIFETPCKTVPQNADPKNPTIEAKSADCSDSESEAEHAPDNNAKTTSSQSKAPFSPFNDSKPLPLLPFHPNNAPIFHRRGSRHIIIPHSKHATLPRATSIQTLVAKFENKIHASNPQLTPLTPRFKMIQNTFQPRSRLTEHTSSFCESLQGHLDSITARIEDVTKAQDEHRRKSLGRSMSFWSFDVNASNNACATAGVAGDRAAGGDEGIRSRGRARERGRFPVRGLCNDN